MEWCTIESDPAVFTELIEKMGVKTPLETDEVVDIDLLESIEGCKGFILLFKYDKDTMAPTSRDAFVSSADPSVFFSKQVSVDEFPGKRCRVPC
jgi:ubiquitin carboxyl-terminal hydrolase L5